MGCSYSKSKPSEETTHADAPEEAPEPVAQNQSGFETCATTDVVVNLPISDEDPEFVKAKLRGRQGQTPLHLASKTADLKQVAHLLAVYPEAANMTDVTGRVPLLVACEEGTSVEVIALLALATAGGLSVRTPIGLHPLHCAVKNRTGAALRIAEHIVALNPLAVTVTGPRGMLACHTAAAAANNVDLFGTILNAFPGAATVQDGNGRLPLHHASANTTSAARGIIRLLIAAHPASLKRTGWMQRLPLHVACAEGNLESALDLAEAYPHAMRIKDGKGSLPLQAAWASRMDSSSQRMRLAVWATEGPTYELLRKLEDLHLEEAWDMPCDGAGTRPDQVMQLRRAAVVKAWMGEWHIADYPCMPLGLRRTMRCALWACRSCPSMRRLSGDCMLHILQTLAEEWIKSPDNVTKAEVESRLKDSGQHSALDVLHPSYTDASWMMFVTVSLDYRDRKSVV